MALKVKNLLVSVEGKQVLNGVSLKVKQGEVVALMGPNGSGKSSLAQALMGNPAYEIVESGRGFGTTVLELDGESLVGKTADERAMLGLFLAFQYPMGIGGVSVREVLLTVLRNKDKNISALELKKRVEQEAKKMEVDEELLSRSLNEGFSGGEKKKMEMLQMKILKPKYAILDETDSGLDIDALKIVAKQAREAARDGVGLLVITHYKRILEYLKPERVLVMKNGRIVAEGKEELVKSLEKKGYKDL